MAVVFLNPKKLNRKLSKLKDVSLDNKIPEEIPVELFDNIYDCAFLSPKEVSEKFSIADLVFMAEHVSAACDVMEQFVNYSCRFKNLEKCVSVGRTRRLF